MNSEPLVVLVETMGPANLGSVARTTAAFGLSRLRLVAPRCRVDEETLKWACYGKRVLDKIEYFPDLPSALHDVAFSVALSRRDGKDRHRHYTLPHLTREVLPQFEHAGQTAFVFGNEESGLAKSHLAACHCSAEIPVIAPDGSLNLAHAVSVTLYELIGRPTCASSKPIPKNVHEERADKVRLNALLERSREILAKIDYPKHRSTLDDEMVKLQSVVWKSGLENWEVRLLLGMLQQIEYKIDNPRC